MIYRKTLRTGEYILRSRERNNGKKVNLDVSKKLLININFPVPFYVIMFSDGNLADKFLIDICFYLVR